MQKDWYKHALCKIHMDMHCPEWHDSIFENFDAHRIISMAAAAGADALYFFTKDCYGNAYYDTKVGHKHRCMGNRDFLAEILEEARKRELPIMAYFTVIWDNHSAETHPDWCMLDPEGRPLMDTVTMDVGKWRYVCHNTGYAEYAAQMIDEISSKYHVQGFHLDMFNLDFGKLSCYCRTCQKMFRDETGKDLPKEPKWDQTWREFLDFRYRSVERLAELLRKTALDNNPDLCVVMNYHGSPNFDWRVGQQPVRHSLFSDLGTGETYTPMLGDMYPGMEARFIRNLVPGKPFEMVAWRMNRLTDFTVKPKNQLLWEMFTSVVNGGSAMLIDQPFHDGRPDEVAYDRMGEVFSEITKLKPFLGGEFVKHVGIYYSCRNRDLYGRDEQAKFLLPIMGAYKAITESHFNVDFLFDETISPQRLAEFPVVYLPNVAALTAKEVTMFDRFVREGGVLIACYDTSLFSENGEQLDNFQLNKVFGVDYKNTVDCDTNYFRNIPDGFGEGIDSRYNVLNQGRFHLVKNTTAIGYGDLHDSFFKRVLPDRFFSHNVHPPYTRMSDAFFVNKHGKGLCVYLPFGCDASYADAYELPEHRMLIRNIIDRTSPPPLVQIEAPLNVESLVTAKDNEIRVFLTAFNPIRQAATLPSLNKPIRPSIRMEEPAIFDAAVRVKVPFTSVTTHDPNTAVETSQDVIRLRCEDVYDVVVIKRAE